MFLSMSNMVSHIHKTVMMCVTMLLKSLTDFHPISHWQTKSHEKHRFQIPACSKLSIACGQNHFLVSCYNHLDSSLFLSVAFKNTQSRPKDIKYKQLKAIDGMENAKHTNFICLIINSHENKIK